VTHNRNFGDTFRLTLITEDATLAARADEAGVDRIGVDLERLGKAERQAGEDTRLSEHTVEDLCRVAGSLARSKAFVRVNPLNEETSGEVNTVIAAGAEVVMLPFFRTATEVESFVRIVDGRARVVILLETTAAVVRIRDILAVAGVDEVMVGLNDLRLEFRVQSHFEVLASPLLDMISREIRRTKLDFSVGGVARADDDLLPVPPDLVLAQYPRLGATGAWISRSFFRGMPADWDFSGALAALRRRLTEWSDASPEALERARCELAGRARSVAPSMKSLRPKT